MEMIEKRVRDGSVLRLIRKWIQVGHRRWQIARERNRYGARTDDQSALGQHLLHYVLDEWFRERSEAPLKGRSARDPLRR